MIRRTVFGPATWMSALFGVMLAAGTAAAQTPNPGSTAKSPATAKHLEFYVGAAFLTPVGMGTQNVSVTAPNGSPVVLASTTSRTAASYGIEARMGFPVNQRFRAEVAGGWSRVNFQTEVTGDTEVGSGITASLGVSRLTAGGAVTWTLRQRARNEIYAIGGASWMREISELSASGVYDDGAIVDGGAGMKMIFKESPNGKIKRLGLRVEGRFGVRIGGLTLDDRNTHIAPVFVGSFLIGS